MRQGCPRSGVKQLHLGEQRVTHTTVTCAMVPSGLAWVKFMHVNGRPLAETPRCAVRHPQVLVDETPNFRSSQRVCPFCFPPRQRQHRQSRTPFPLSNLHFCDCGQLPVYLIDLCAARPTLNTNDRDWGARDTAPYVP